MGQDGNHAQKEQAMIHRVRTQDGEDTWHVAHNPDLDFYTARAMDAEPVGAKSVTVDYRDGLAVGREHSAACWASIDEANAVAAGFAEATGLAFEVESLRVVLGDSNGHYHLRCLTCGGRAETEHGPWPEVQGSREVLCWSCLLEYAPGMAAVVTMPGLWERWDAANTGELLWMDGAWVQSQPLQEASA